MKRVLVTGMGIISAIGENLSENHASLRQGKTGIARAAHFDSRYAALLPFGECACSNERLKELLNLEDSAGYTRTDLLADKAFAEAIKDAALSPNQISSFDTAFISATTVGGMCLTDQLYQDANLKTSGSPYLEAYSCAAHTIRLVENYKIKGFSDTINTACSSSANAIMLGARLIESGRAKRAIVGGVDSLAKYTVNGFNSLKILSSEACKPFDENRDGLNLGEAAAYLVLEAEDVVGNKNAYAEVAGYGNANDAHHPSAMSEEATGAIRSMQEAVESAGISFDRIDYVNAHGTGTLNNDEVELLGMSLLFDEIPPFSSTKSYTGHTLGAAGAVEAVFSILSIVHDEIFASLHVETPMSSQGARAASVFSSEKKLSYALSNSFGFGGNCTSLVFRSIH
ncbi:beta-ketoacyl-[acyl-carrier-protein] synthase family protein [Dyadobacter chenwenxiniae]|uniref:Beta-ketoacyl-[acyl-carrier-protein] synthase family protein n=1 Tax=Dyadobacter chenwenxiniae TaxID=2906456 RepID=A0A9X1PM83_9BACT|nr:beta-ketoacyl-[acyl-carrier-protein] synthase family protein [Dyadobacter chenwenxiniae]MCF0063705.1 beta-ketoacyl-[acyl-carrier-protein] synthase family protein [Dyadobacter chenwenxiniae]UON83381.1 beta-ketoacyl-[acyl-carrier-protein] synthase family protein [Dyadobacter chenwenxiniae]